MFNLYLKCLIKMKMYFLTIFIFAVLSKEVLSVEEYICEHQTLNIECPDCLVLLVSNATYGRHNSSICSSLNQDKNINCSSPNATETVQQRCNGRNNCTLLVSNQLFGDPCRGTFKYLEINYTCEPRGPIPFELGPGPVISHCGPNEERRCENNCYRETCNSEALPPGCDTNSCCTYRCVCQIGYKRDPTTGECVEKDNCPPVEEHICENDILNIDCPLSTVVHINSAIYGRHNSTICAKKGLDQNVNCSSNVTDIVRKQCDADRGNNCTLQVSNQIFNDPCVGTYKYLEINYICKYIRPVIWPRPRPSICEPDKELGCINPCVRQCQPPKICNMLCQRGCVCKTGLKRDPKTNKCVAENHCPLPGTECETHEVYSDCGAGCQATCANRNPICTLQCVSGYVCAENYIRNKSGQCVPLAQCPKRR